MGKTVNKPPLPRLDTPEMQAMGAQAVVAAKIVENNRDRAKKMLAGSRQGERASQADLTEATVGAFRGALGLAARLRIEFEAAPKGSAQRARILTIAYDMVKNNDKREEATAIDGMSDEEIENEIVSIMEGRMNKDSGSPKTDEGKKLLFDILQNVGNDEYQALEKEILALDANFEFDKLAVAAANAMGADSASELTPKDDEDEDDFEFEIEEVE